MKNLKPVFLKKVISKREWINFYSQTGTYMKLSEERMGGSGDVLIAFMTANLSEMPANCSPMNEFEMRDFDLFCERENLSPRPFQKLF